jgi:hypothetical protein
MGFSGFGLEVSGAYEMPGGITGEGQNYVVANYKDTAIGTNPRARTMRSAIRRAVRKKLSHEGYGGGDTAATNRGGGLYTAYRHPLALSD